jgi:hypothetical protein
MERAGGPGVLMSVNRGTFLKRLAYLRVPPFA